MTSPKVTLSPVSLAMEGSKVRFVRAWTMTAVLSALFVVSMVDRFALGLLVEPLKQDLHLSDIQLGLLFGSAFAIFYGFISVPMARLADRGNRVRLILIAVILWSTCTLLSGFATSFAMLVLLRIGLAIGESALVPAGYSLITDTLPPERRTIGTALFNAAGTAGASGAYLIGSGAISLIQAIQSDGHLQQFRMWQGVFFVVGLPGLVLALLLLIVAREPRRMAVADSSGTPTFKEVLRYAKSQGWLYVGLLLGAGCLQLTVNAFLAWAPSYLFRLFDMPVAEAGRKFGSSIFVAFVSGSLIIPMIGAWLARRRDDGVVLVGAGCAFMSVIFGLGAVLQNTVSAFLAFTFVGLFFAVGGTAHTVASIHIFAPAKMRATLVALMLICLTTVALGIGPPLAGAVAGVFGSGKAALGVGIGFVAAFGGTVSFLLFLAARKRTIAYLARTRIDASN